MDVTETSADGLKRAYTIKVDAATMSGKLDEKLHKMAGQIRLPGFRPGKVPIAHLRKLHGTALLGEVLEETVNNCSRDALEAKEVKPALQPDIEIKSFEEGGDLEFDMSVEILPDFEHTDFSTISLKRQTAEVEDAEIDETLDRLASQQTSYEAAGSASYKAKMDDAVIIDFLGKMDGEPFEGGTAEDYQLVLGSNALIPGFEEQLVGEAAGSEVAVNVTFPDDYHSPDLAGKDTVFDVTVKEVRQPAKVEIDDEFAKKLGMEDLAKLREQVGKQLGEEHDQVSRSKLKRGLLDELAQIHDFEVPEGMVALEVDQMLEDFKRSAGQESSDADDVAESEPEPEPDEETRQEYQDLAVRRVRLGLLLADVGTKNKIEVGAEELNGQIMREAQRFPGQEREVFEFYQKNPQAMQQLRAPIYEDKVIDFILEMAKVADEKVDREALYAPLPEEGAGKSGTKEKGTKKKSAAAAKKKKDSEKSKDA